ncbi:hypothetical protein HK405_010224 [Cladochytrium tenue]|nr:hypothetical protein HK405_010224 [Cladochytrium tenue]
MQLSRFFLSAVAGVLALAATPQAALADSTSTTTTAATTTATTTTAASTASVSLTIIKPYEGTVYSFDESITITWSSSGTASSSETVYFVLEDLRNGASTGQALSPALGNSSLTAYAFTTDALSSLFASAVVTTGTAYSVRVQLGSSYYYSPEFEIDNGDSSASGSTTTGTSATASTTSKSTSTSKSSTSAAAPGRLDTLAALSAAAAAVLAAAAAVVF